MSDPSCQEFSASAIIKVDKDVHKARVLCGNYTGIAGPIVDPNTDVRYLDVALAQGRSFTYELDANMAAFVYSL
jgi:redox-sensitive bicupin YhaK (pirin superfamily)